MEDFEGNRTVVLEIAGEMDGGHATTPELTLERVATAQGLGERGRGVGDDGGSIGSRDDPNLRLPGELRQRAAAGRSGGAGRPCGDVDRGLQRIDLWRHGSLQARFGDSATHPHLCFHLIVEPEPTKSTSGVGRSLMAALHGVAWQRGRSLLILNARQGGPAVGFYKGSATRRWEWFPGTRSGRRESGTTMSPSISNWRCDRPTPG